MHIQIVLSFCLIAILGIGSEEALGAPQVKPNLNLAFIDPRHPTKTFGVGAGVTGSHSWTSDNGRHQLGLGGGANAVAGRINGRSFHTPINVNGQGQYSYRNGPHTFGLGANAAGQIRRGRGRPSYGVHAGYQFRFGK